MAQAVVENVVMEVMGTSDSMNSGVVGHLVVEVLGKFQFGGIDVDRVIMEILGLSDASFTRCNVGSVQIEALGQWSDF